MGRYADAVAAFRGGIDAGERGLEAYEKLVCSRRDRALNDSLILPSCGRGSFGTPGLVALTNAAAFTNSFVMSTSKNADAKSDHTVESASASQAMMMDGI